MIRSLLAACTLAAAAAAALSDTPAGKHAEWLTFKGAEGPGKGKHIVLVSGDEEYRSEEALPQLAKILARRHGFDCTVLFAIDPNTGLINPNVNNNIPGLEALDRADLMVIATRFRNLPDGQMKHVVDYLQSGRPVVGLRTATHAFAIPAGHKYAKYDWNSRTWPGGFGRQVLGETWVNHHGQHGRQSTRGILAPGAEGEPILRGIKSGDIWGPTDVYTVHLPLPEGSKVLVLGEVLEGMSAGDPPVKGKQNDPMMPVAWTRSYAVTPGKEGKAFATTMGAATDLQSEGLRRLLVNACYWAVGLGRRIPARANVEIVGEYHPTPFGFNGFVKGRRPADYK